MDQFFTELALRAATASRRPDADRTPDGQGWSLAYVGFMNALGWCGATFFLFCLVASTIAWQRQGKPASALAFTATIFGALLLVCLYVLLASRRRVEIRAQGLRFIGPFAASSLPWVELASVEYKLSSSAIDICSRAGRRHRVYLYCVHGASRLRWALERYAPEASESARNAPGFDELVPRLQP